MSPSRQNPGAESGRHKKKREPRARGEKQQEMNPRKMTVPVRERAVSERSEEGGGPTCQVCMNGMEVFSVGECNHPVCHTCSTRMRVLCQRNECAICRQDLPKVIYTMAELKFDDIKDNIYPMDRKYKICFETEEIQNEYTAMLDHRCPVCPDKVLFKTFRQLDQHIRREHELYYCDLCVTNLKIFTHERKFYSRKALVEHRRKGDPDDSSFKGHPLCEFCDQRFIDDEELFKHLRRDHYFCHFCDADGLQYFYSEYRDLRQHFHSDHWLCEEPRCEEEKFVVFRTELDLKGHRLERHGGNLSKAASKEARKVELEFSYSRREVAAAEPRGRGGGRGRDRHAYSENSPEPEPEPELAREAAEAAVPDLRADFPTLGGMVVPAELPSSRPAPAPQSWSTRGGGAPTNFNEEFPSLGGVPAPTPAAPPPSVAAAGSTRPAPQQQQQMKRPVEEFPGLPTTRKPLSLGPARPAAVARPAPAAGPAPALVRQAQPAAKPRKTFKDPFDEDDYPSLGEEPSNLSNSSKKIVKNSGQDFNYSSTEHKSNITTIDKSFLESQKPISNSSGSSKVNLTADAFPGLGKPERPLDLGKNNSKKTKKQKKASTTLNNNNVKYAGDAAAGTAKSGLSGICSFLGGSQPDSKASPPPPATAVTENVRIKEKITEERKVQPIVNKKSDSAEIFRPSKVKKSSGILNQANHTEIRKTELLTEDFPSLGNSKKKLGANFVQANDKLVKNKENKSQWTAEQKVGRVSEVKSSGAPPPGFSQPKLKHKTPPGFSRSQNNYKFSAPDQFQQRNVKLITTITGLIGGKSLEFGMFKDISGQFRAGKLSSASYFSRCTELVENNKFNQFFPELVVLLPDIEKQVELYELYKREGWSEAGRLACCPTCSQVTLTMELQQHAVSHEKDTEYPQL